MLAGLYLIMPVISAWLERASRSELKTLLGVWGVTLLLPYAKMFAPMLGYTCRPAMTSSPGFRLCRRSCASC